MKHDDLERIAEIARNVEYRELPHGILLPKPTFDELILIARRLIVENARLRGELEGIKMGMEMFPRRGFGGENL